MAARQMHAQASLGATQAFGNPAQGPLVRVHRPRHVVCERPSRKPRAGSAHLPDLPSAAATMHPPPLPTVLIGHGHNAGLVGRVGEAGRWARAGCHMCLTGKECRREGVRCEPRHLSHGAWNGRVSGFCAAFGPRRPGGGQPAHVRGRLDVI